MKKHIIYLIAILIPLISVSCEDFLDVTPKAEVEGSELFETEQGFKDALNGIYIGLTDTRTYGKNLTWFALEYMAHQYDASGGSYEELQNFDYENSTSVSTINSIWLKQYNTISEINLLLESVDKYGGILDTTTYNAVKGEALALRAFCHFDLLRLFGHGDLENRPELLSRKTIPYVTTHSKKITAQKSYSETFELLENDLEEALEYLEWGENNPLRMNNNAVIALQARVFLWQGKHAEALQTIEQLLPINSAWATTSSTAFFTSENLFQLNVTRLKDYMELSYVTHINGNFNYDRLSQNSAFVNDIFGIDEDGLGAGLSDLRYIKQHQFESSSAILAIKLQITEDAVSANYLIPMIKIGEVYLIAAEAALKEGDLLTARERVNFLKGKRNIKPEFFLPEAATLEEIEDAIEAEYRKEFIQEGQLFYFYKRKGGEESFPGDMGEVLYDMNDTKYVLPYPSSEIEFGRVQEI